MGQGRHTLRSISDPVYPRELDKKVNKALDQQQAQSVQ